MDLLELAMRAVMFFVPFLFALCFHELAHGFVAKLRGDNTAEMMGRLTMNPMAHADMVGTFILPLTGIVLSTMSGAAIPMFGWAKPVPVNPRNLAKPRIDMFWIALAGPLSNILLAVLGGAVVTASIIFMGATSSLLPAVLTLFKTFIAINFFLAFFNIIPLHPLDGGKVLARFLPREINYKLEQNEHISGIVLMVLVIGGFLSILAWPVHVSTNFVFELAKNIAFGLMA